MSEPLRLIGLKDLYCDGLLCAGDHLAPTDGNFQTSAFVTNEATLRFEDGTTFSNLSLAANHCARLEGGSGGRHGWYFWCTSNGYQLEELRQKCLNVRYSQKSELKRNRIIYWDGFLSWCADNPQFMDVFGDSVSGSRRVESSLECSYLFVGGLVIWNAVLSKRGSRNGNRNQIGLNIEMTNLDAYAKLYRHYDAFDELADELGCELSANPVEDAKGCYGQDLQRRVLTFVHPLDASDGWRETSYDWHIDALLRVRELELSIIG